jgi:arginyl-tRNA synthetase
MSTRGGDFVTLRELRKEVGNDAARFFYIMRKPEQHLDFDLELAKSRSNENPVYYIQYAHARICSIFRKLEADNNHFDASTPASEEQLALLTSEHEQALITHLTDYPAVLEKSAKQYAPHIIAHYCQRLAQLFHAYYNAESVLGAPEPLQMARLYLLKATQLLLSQSMALLGCTCPTEM